MRKGFAIMMLINNNARILVLLNLLQLLQNYRNRLCHLIFLATPPSSKINHIVQSWFIQQKDLNLICTIQIKRLHAMYTYNVNIALLEVQLCPTVNRSPSLIQSFIFRLLNCKLMQQEQTKAALKISL